jgi:hypothetical protein
MQASSLRRYLPLLVPLLASFVPWIASFTLLRDASGQDMEGAYYVCGFFAALSFLLTAPLAAIALSKIIHGGTTMSLTIFNVLFFLVSLPVISFNGVAYSASIIPLLLGFLLPGDIQSTPLLITILSGVAFGIYGLYALAMYPLAKRGLRATILGAAIIFAAGLALTVMKVALS